MIAHEAELYCEFRKLGAPHDAQEHVIGAIEHSAHHSDISLEFGYPSLGVHTTSTESTGFAEVWRSSDPVETGEQNGVAYGHTGEYVFGAIRVPESAVYAAQVEHAYAAIFDVTRSLGYGTLFRTWAYVQDINGTNADGLEVYRDFCVGRARAVDRHGIRPEDMPAATGVGAHSGGITCYFLAARSARRINIENPNLTTAHHYPSQYGPKPPIFARATYISQHGEGDHRPGTLYLSATASILGHETVNKGNLAGQCAFALENIARITEDKNLELYGLARNHTLADVDHLKIYVRHREDLGQVRRICSAMLSPTANVSILHTDIARADLLVEIEGIVPWKGCDKAVATDGISQER
jgi:chorismatase